MFFLLQGVHSTIFFLYSSNNYPGFTPLRVVVRYRYHFDVVIMNLSLAAVVASGPPLRLRALICPVSFFFTKV